MTHLIVNVRTITTAELLTLFTDGAFLLNHLKPSSKAHDVREATIHAYTEIAAEINRRIPVPPIVASSLC